MNISPSLTLIETGSSYTSVNPEHHADVEIWNGSSIHRSNDDLIRAVLISASSGILSLDDAAAVLRCSIDSLRRVPISELPTYEGPGRGVLYMLDDIQQYLRTRKRLQRRGSGLGTNSKRPRPEPYTPVSNQAERALRSLGKGAL